MLAALHRLAARLSRPGALVAAVVANLACVAGFIWRAGELEVELLDGRGWYTAADVQALLSSLTEDQRDLYALSELSLDVIYPLAYAGLLIGIIHRLLPTARARLLQPLAALTFDLTENILIFSVTQAWTGSPPAAGLVAAASTVTLAKWSAIALSLLAVLDALARRLTVRPTDALDQGFVARITEVLEAELSYVRVRRRLHASPVEPRETLIGLSLSGGGIRSATTCLGVLQGLSRMRILPLVDYLSTVSGGGYIGACLTTLLSLPRKGTIEPFFSTEWASFPFNPMHREGRTQLDHLRTHGSFLVTRSGLLARETMRSLGHLVSGTVYHLVTALLALLVVALLYMAGIFTISPDLHDTLSGATPLRYVRDDPAYAESRPLPTERNVFRQATLSERVGHKAALIRDAAWQAGNTGYGLAVVAGAVVFGIVLAIASFLYLRQSRRAIVPPEFGESEDEAQERALLRRVGGYGLGSTVVVFAVAWWNYTEYAGVLWLFILPLALLSAMATAFVVHVFLPRLERQWNRRTRSLWGAFQAMASYGFWVTLLLALLPLATYAFREEWRIVGLSGLASLGIARLLTKRSSVGAGRFTLPAGARNALLSIVIAASAMLALIAITGVILPDGNIDAVRPRFWMAAAIGAAVFLLLGWVVDANRVSPHYFYQDRLGETYLFTEARMRSGVLHRVRNSLQMRLRDLHGVIPAAGDATRAATSPYHLVSVAINLAGSRDLTRKDRKSGYFLFSRLFCGSTHTGFLASDQYQSGETRVARAITISGAAASSAIGMSTFFAQAFATVLFNLRLGYWMPNPRKAAARAARDGWFFWPRWLLREMFMRTDDRSALVNLSDGGHTGDNVGIYPLLQRRCRVIIAVDAEKDADLSFGSLTEALRHAYIDLGIDVDIDFTMLRPDPTTGMSRAHCAVGLIRYPPVSRFGRQEELPSMADVDPAESGMVGYLIYLKNSLTGDEPEPVLNYKAKNPAFPHETTVDQFFDDGQFESYRALGLHIAEESLGRWIQTPEFEAFRQQFWPFQVNGHG